MSADISPPPALSPRLDELLHSLSDQAFAQRMREVYAAAGQAILRLSDLDLLKYESASVEELGPLVMSKIQGVPGITRTVTCTVVHA